jgi:hypothetical protein
MQYLLTVPIELFELILSACGIEQLRVVIALAATSSELASMTKRNSGTYKCPLHS